MKKKYIFCASLVGVIVLFGGVVHASDLKDELMLYLQDPSLDFLGHEFEDILFKRIQNGDNHFLEELKFILDDIKTMPLQVKAMYKILTQTPNVIAYGSLGGVFGLKSALGTTLFNESALEIFDMLKNIKFAGLIKSLFKLLKI